MWFSQTVVMYRIYLIVPTVVSVAVLIHGAMRSARYHEVDSGSVYR